MIRRLEEYARENNIPIMQKDGIEYLCKFISDNKIKNILEVGSAIGYSAINMALEDKNIKVTTLEKDIVRYNEAVKNIKRFNLDNQINIINIDACLYNPLEDYDLIFIDAAKGKNKFFFEKFSSNLKEDGFIITDNLSFHGLVENNSLVLTKNQRGIVNKIKDYITFLDNNNDYQTTYVSVGDKIAISRKKNKYVVIPRNLDNLKELLNYPLEGFIISIESLSINGNFYISVDKLKDIITSINPKKIFISLNKIMHNSDLELLDSTLKKLSKLNIYKILFYDFAVYNLAKKYNLADKLMIYQEHLNRSTYSHKFYQSMQITSSYISSDITKKEIDDIKNSTNMSIMMNVYGCIPMFYSRRYLLDSYLKYINVKKSSSLYYLKHNEEYYPIIEESSGTAIYTKKINLINRVRKLNNIDFLVINLFDTSNNQIIEDFLSNKSIDDTFEGFYNKDSYYQVKGDDKNV